MAFPYQPRLMVPVFLDTWKIRYLETAEKKSLSACQSIAVAATIYLIPFMVTLYLTDFANVLASALFK